MPLTTKLVHCIAYCAYISPRAFHWTGLDGASQSLQSQFLILAGFFINLIIIFIIIWSTTDDHLIITCPNTDSNNNLAPSPATTRRPLELSGWYRDSSQLPASLGLGHQPPPSPKSKSIPTTTAVLNVSVEYSVMVVGKRIETQRGRHSATTIAKLWIRMNEWKK